MKLRTLIALGMAGCATVGAAAAEVQEPAAAATPATHQEPAALPEAPPTLLSLADPLEATRRTAEPIAHLRPFDASRLRPLAGPAFLASAWQQQLFFQRSIDARNPYYATGLPR